MDKSLMKRTLCLAAVYAALTLICFPGQVDASGNGDGIGYRIARALQEKDVSSYLIVVFIAALPIVELRGAIPVAHHMFHMHPVTAYILAVIGNMIPVFPLLLFLGPASSFLMKFKAGRRFFEWFFERTRRKSASIERYETLGVSAFVAIPLPVTGAWTGCAAAFLMGLRFRHAVIAILLGVMVAGLIVTALSMMGWMGALIAGTVLITLLVSAILRILRREQPEK